MFNVIYMVNIHNVSCDTPTMIPLPREGRKFARMKQSIMDDRGCG